MHFIRNIVTMTAVLASTGLYAQGGSDINQDAVNERDPVEVREFIQGNRASSLENKLDKFNFSGDVRFEYQHKREKHDGTKVRDGVKGATYLGQNNFDVELNLRVDYTGDRDWAKAVLEFDNNAGVRSNCRLVDSAGNDINGAEQCQTGSCNDICLKQAIYGYRLCDSDSCSLEVMAGRTPMYKEFNSRLMFKSQFDGVILSAAHKTEDFGTFYAKGGAFVIDYTGNAYGWVVAAGMKDIANIGLDLGVAHVDFSMHSGRHAAGIAEDLCQEIYDYATSQISANYHVDPDLIGQDVELYGAVLYNWNADKLASVDAGKENWAWVAGAKIGDLKGQGDWAIDANYQYVEAQAIQQDDMNGIGRGNARKACFLPSQGYSSPTPAGLAGGNGNFKGFLVEAAYAVTDNITASVEFEATTEVEKKVGGSHSYQKAEFEVLYHF